MSNFEVLIHITELPSEEIVPIAIAPRVPVCVPTHTTTGYYDFEKSLPNVED